MTLQKSIVWMVKLKVDNIAITAICDITHSSPSNSTIVLATFGGLFLIGGILQTTTGTIWLLISWVKRRKEKGV